MKFSSRSRATIPLSARHDSGFTLIELMVAIALGLLVSIGIVTLFQSTSNTSRVQDSLARLQENGRFAVSRLVDDFRMGLGQPLSTDVTSLKQARNTNSVQSPLIAPTVYVADIASYLPRWIAGDLVVPATWNIVGTSYPLSPRWLIQGHECDLASTVCTPTVPATLPAVGNAAGQRVRGADVLTVRYIGSAGWAIAKSSTGAGGSKQVCDPATDRLTSIEVMPQGGEPATNFGKDTLNRNDLALLWSGTSASIFQVQISGAPGAAVQTLVPINVLPTGGVAGIPCPAAGTSSSATLYNFSRDLRSVTYFLQLIADPNPDATAGRVIPALMRWVEGNPLNTRTAEVMATGVERLDFVYGVETIASPANLTVFNFLDANQVQTTGTTANCIMPPAQYTQYSEVALITPYLLDANCLWRSVRTIEAHMLINTINDIQFLRPSDEAYRYSVNGGAAVTYAEAVIPTGTLPTALMPNGLQRGRMMRREFTANIAVRNGSP